MVVLVVLVKEAFMTDHENTQHQPNTGETDQTHESGWIAAVRKRGAEFLKLTRGSLRTAQMIHQHGFPLPPYKKERQPATPEEMKVLNDALSTVTTQAEAANAAPIWAAAHDSIDPLHHEAVLTHEGDTQDSAHSPKTHIYYDGKLIKTQTFSQLYARMLHQKPETNQRTIVSPED